jgi:iron complex outermembrane receptor protein
VFVPARAANPVANFAQGTAPYIISKGLDINVTSRPVEGLTLNAGLLYNPTSYASSFLVACNPTQTPGVGSCSATGTTHATPQLAGAPVWRFLLNGEYDREIAAGLNGFVQSDFTYQSSRFLSATPDPLTVASEQHLWNGRIGVRTTNGRWGISAFVRNLLNENYSALTPDALSGFDGGAGLSYWVIPVHGRSWGVTLDARL